MTSILQQPRHHRFDILPFLQLQRSYHVSESRKFVSFHDGAQQILASDILVGHESGRICSTASAAEGAPIWFRPPSFCRIGVPTRFMMPSPFTDTNIEVQILDSNIFW